MAMSMFDDSAEKSWEAVPKRLCPIFKAAGKAHGVKVSCVPHPRDRLNFVNIKMRAHAHSWAASNAQLGSAVEDVRGDPSIPEAWRNLLFR